MKMLSAADLTNYVEQNIGLFHQKRIEGLSKLSLSSVLKRKNPYLFKAKNVQTASDIVKAIADAHVSSSEETIFGDWLEGLAIFVNQNVYNGQKSAAKGIDLEFEKENKRYIVSIKSGPNWGNSSQIQKMILDFKSARKTLSTSGHKLEIVAVNGCCIGSDIKPFKGDYYKYCGQEFWEFISGDPGLYLKIIEPLGHKAREKNQEFLEAYSNMLNRFAKEFLDNFCDTSGAILWEYLTKFNSGRRS